MHRAPSSEKRSHISRRANIVRMTRLWYGATQFSFTTVRMGRYIIILKARFYHIEYVDCARLLYCFVKEKKYMARLVVVALACPV